MVRSIPAVLASPTGVNTSTQWRLRSLPSQESDRTGGASPQMLAKDSLTAAPQLPSRTGRTGAEPTASQSNQPKGYRLPMPL